MGRDADDADRTAGTIVALRARLVRGRFCIPLMSCVGLACGEPAAPAASTEISESRQELTGPEAFLDEKLDAVCAEFRAIRDADPDWARFSGCASSCDAYLEEALSTIVYTGARIVDEDTLALGDALVAVGGPAAWSHIVDRYGRSTDPADRLALLSVLLRARLERRPLPVDVFVSVSSESVTERGMVLELHRTVPPPSDAVTGIRALAVSPTTPLGLRNLAVTALGHSQTADALVEAARYYRTNGLVDRSTAMHLGNALGRCGASCADVLEDYIASTNEWERQTVYLAAARDRTGALLALRARVDPTTLSVDERRFYERGFGE